MCPLFKDLFRALGGSMSVKKCLAAVSFLFVLPASVLASGFGVFTQGASGLGQANAVVAHSTGPSSAYFNPALLTQVSGTQIEIGTTGVYAKHKVKLDSTGQTQDGKESWEFPSTFYLTHQINDRLTAGLAVFFPFGLSSEWDKDDFEGRYIGTYGEITTTNINPVLAFKVNDSVSLAAGVSAIYFDAELKSMLNQDAIGKTLTFYGVPFPTLTDAEQKFTGDDWGFGFNLGLTAKLTDALTFGMAYRSKVELEADGKVQISGVDEILSDVLPNTPLAPFADMLQSNNGKADVTLPQQIVAGLAYRFSESFVTEVGVRWEDWESTDDLTVKFDNGQSAPPIPRDWRSTWTYNIGGQYLLNENFALNAGYLYGQNAVPGDTMEVLIPDSDAHLFTIGAEWMRGPWKVAGAFGYEYHESRRKNNEIGDPIGQFLGTNSGTANGKYENEIYLVGLSVGYAF
jgi:long-chain fatty acid transport protein